jgi:uncharacterized protein involved in exopolysaccharide biosynthesis/Mrp family chromosome partitioning ATPase
MRDKNEYKNITTEDEIKDFLKPIKSHSKAFMVFTVLSMLFTVYYLYTSEKIYRSEAKIEIIPTIQKQQQITLEAETNTNIETEIDKIQSRNLVKKVIENLNETIRYFEIRFLKKVEVYHNTPFKVIIHEIKSDQVYGKRFIIKPSSKDSFYLEIEKPLIERIKGKKYPFEKKYRYGEKIETPFASFSVEKIKDFSKPYLFTVVNKEDLIDEALSRLSVEKTSKYSSVLEISYEDNIPKRAKDFIDNLIFAYIEESAKGRTQEIKQKLKFINSQLEIVSQNLHKSEVALERFKKQNKIIDISSEAQVTIQKLSEFDKSYAKLLIEKRILDDVYHQVKTSENKTINLYGIKDPVLVSLVQDYNKLVAKKQSLLTEYTQLHPDVEKLNAQLEKIKTNIQQAVLNLRNEINDRISGTKTVIYRYENFLRSLPEKEKEFIRIKRNYAVNEKIYSYLIQKKLEASLAEISALAGVRIIDDASLPKAPIKPKKNILLVLGALIGLLFGTAYGYMRDLFEDKIKYINEIERLISIPIVGIIPHFKKKKLQEALLHPQNGNEAVSKVFRILKANLQLLFKKTRRSQVILITSPEKNDGKTTVSANLGVSFGLGSNDKVVVVDLNFDDPKLHRYFNNISNETGILDILKRYSYTDKELDNLIERNVLEKEVLKSVFNVIEKEKQKKENVFLLEELEGILDTVIRKSFKNGFSVEDSIKSIHEEVKNVVDSINIKDAKKLYIKLTNAVNTAVKRFSKEKVLTAEKEKIFRAQIKYSTKKVPAFENLYIITAGTVEKEDVFLSKNLIFTSDILKNIIKELKKEFRYIILNTPSIYSVPEVFMLMEESDISLIVFRIDKTKKQSIKDIDRKISEIGIENVGVVVNDVKEKLINGVLE